MGIRQILIVITAKVGRPTQRADQRRQVLRQCWTIVLSGRLIGRRRIVAHTRNVEGST